jgi:Protein of unknown function (DUF992)
MIRRSLSILAATVAALTATAIPAGAQSGIEAGMLQCRGGANTAYVVGSLSSFDCVFQPTYGGPPQHYVANLRRAGVDLGVTQDAVLGWAVFAPTRAIGPGALTGGYGGVSAVATIGIGAGANALVGGLDNSFALQPVSFQAQRGLNVTASITGLELQYAAYVPPRRHKRRH